MTIRWPCFI